MGGKTKVPVLRMVKISEASLNERANKIDGQSGSLVSPQQQRRVGSPFLQTKPGAIDHIAAKARQCGAGAGFSISRTRFSVLARNATHSDDALFRALHQ